MRDPRLHPQALAALEAAAELDPIATVPREEIDDVRAEQREAGLDEPRQDLHEVRDLEVGGVPCRRTRSTRNPRPVAARETP